MARNLMWRLKFDFRTGAGQVGPVRDALVRSLEAGKRARDATTPEVSALRASPRDAGARTAAHVAALRLSEKAGELLAEDVAQRQLTPERRAALGQERARQDRAKVS
jgi:hypothetical protein